MRKIVLIILIILILLIASLSLGLRYINTYYLPKVINEKITQEAARQFGIDIKIGDIKFELLKGITLNNISISNMLPPISSLEIDRVSANILILPFLRHKTIIFPSVNIYSPKYDIIRYEDDRFNFYDLIPKQINQNKTAPPYSILIHRINIFDSQISFLDKTTQPYLEQTLELKNLGIQIIPSGLNFNLNGELLNGKQASALKLSGSFEFENKELKISSELDKLNAIPYLVYFDKLPISMESLAFDNIFVKGTLLENKLSIAASANISDADFITDAQLTKEQTKVTNTTAKLNTTLDIDLKDTANLNYIVGIDELNVNLEIPAIADKINIEYGKIQISPDKLVVDSASINTLQTKFKIKGDLQNFSDPVFEFNVKSSLDLATVKNFLVTYFDSIEPIIINGEAFVNVDITKSESNNEAGFKGLLKLKNASIKDSIRSYEINNINGVIDFEKDRLEWSNLSFDLFGKTFSSKAAISNLKLPSVNLELYNDKINISTKFNTEQKNSYRINYLKGNYYNSEFDASGNLAINEKGYYADIGLELIIDLADLKQIENLPKEQLVKINPQGKCKIDGKIHGDAKYPAQLETLLNLNAKELKVYGYKITDLGIQIVQEDKQIKIPQANCEFYDGLISLNGLIDLDKTEFPYAFKILGNDINLAKLKLDIPINDEKFKGTLSSLVILKGQAKPMQDPNILGEFLIKDGYLWGFNPLKKLGDFLFIPKYETLIFKKAKGNFSIQDKKAYFEDVVLSSAVLLFACEGTIDFAGNLNLDITPKAPTDVTENLGEYEKFFAGIFSEAGGVVSVKITGTVKEPKYEKKLILLQVLNRAKDEIVNKIKDFTDWIFGGQEEKP